MSAVRLAQTRLLVERRKVESRKKILFSSSETPGNIDVTAQRGSFWVPARRPLLQYVKLLIAAAERGDALEVSWLLSQKPADLSDLQLEGFHSALFAAVLNGHHKTVETLLQHYNPEKTTLVLPTCIELGWAPAPVGQSDQPCNQPISFLGLAYGWERFAREAKGQTLEEMEGDKAEGMSRCYKRNYRLFGQQYLGLMQLLLEYGVRPASGLEGLLQGLSCTADMAAVAMLEAHHLDIGSCQLSDGQTMLSLLVSTRLYDKDEESKIKEWQNTAAPMLRRLLSDPSAILRHDGNNKTAMEICLPEYNQFKAAMSNARSSVGPVHRDNRGSSHCVVCMDQPPSVVIIPCGHLCVCQSCSHRLQQQCPVCRGAATQMILTYPP